MRLMNMYSYIPWTPSEVGRRVQLQSENCLFCYVLELNLNIMFELNKYYV